MRISDWSSDVCSSDLLQIGAGLRNLGDYGASVIARRTWQCPCRHQCTTWRVPCPHFAFAFHIVASSARAHPMRQWGGLLRWRPYRSEEHTSELQSLMRISYAVFCLKKKKKTITSKVTRPHTC